MNKNEDTARTATGLGNENKSNLGPPLIDPSLTSSNPGTYEDLHKKTKG
jgi:hypothetical protein